MICTLPAFTVFNEQGVRLSQVSWGGGRSKTQLHPSTRKLLPLAELWSVSRSFGSLGTFRG